MGESIPGTEQKRNAESTLPLPLEEIELWRAHLTDIWCALHPHIASLVAIRACFRNSYLCHIQDGLAGHENDRGGGAAEDGADARRTARDLCDPRAQVLLAD
jgi:hypothetical protein